MSASTRTVVRTEISRIPTAVRKGAIKMFGITFYGAILTPLEEIDALTDYVVNSSAPPNDTLDVIRKATPVAPPVSGTDPALGAQLDATSAVASRAETTALDALQRANAVQVILLKKIEGLSDSVISTAKFASGVANRLDKAETAIGAVNIDEDSITRAVNKVVADAFAPFKTAVETAGVQTTVADIASVYVTDTKSAKDVFGVEVLDPKGNPVMVRIWNDPSAPAIDPYFVWTEKVLRHFLLADVTESPMWMGGDKGTGKSESARNFAGYTGRAFKRLNFTKQTQVEDFIGATGYDPVKGTYFEKKDFLVGYTHPSTVILLDEPTNLDPAILAILNGFLEPNSAVSYGGAVHKRATGVLVFSADNTLGSGDESGRYAGTKVMNSALIDRFAQVIRMEYLPLDAEIDAVTRHTGCTKDLAKHVLKSVRVARQKVQSADIVDAPSIRSVVAFIKALKVLPVKDAWDATIANRQPSESATALEAIRVACIDETFISNNI
jgi:MoxR-like ATPase